RFEAEQPFKGMKITTSIHMEAKTAYLALCLAAGGAEVHATGCNPLSTQDDVAAGLASMGVNTYAEYGVDKEQYEKLLLEALACKPNLIIDDGGDLVETLYRHPELAAELIGGAEETTTGIHRLKARAKAGVLQFPMMNVNDAKCKHYYDNKYGTGQSVWDAIMHTTNLLVAGRTVVVAGYGYCGRGVAMRAKGMGANVIVTEIDPIKALEASMDGCRVMPMDKAAREGDIFVTTTGCRDVITRRHFEVMKNNAFLSNAGHFNVEVNGEELENMAVRVYKRRNDIMGYELPDGRTLNLLAEGRLVNLASGNGHPAEIMDTSFAIQALAMEYMAKNGRGLNRQVYEVPKEIDDEVSRIKLAGCGMEIDRLTPEQEAYMNGFEV
ncbi:MAG: adenosylhomocysteinase, partial [Clostridiales bacterium]|nr:adenosylhomocysteinase [Clostridiales bacterium]